MAQFQISLPELFAMIGEREVELTILRARIAGLEAQSAQTVPNRATLKEDITPLPSKD